MILLDGKLISEQVKLNIQQELKEYIANGHRKPHLVAILVGNDGASLTYVNSKEKNSKAIGFDSTIYRLPDHTLEIDLISLINELNENQAIDGILVQSPLPKNINEKIDYSSHFPKQRC
jgi:methylenetetrahydrofolate dehydrogenase (NADP+) / methenyltetrahydrofolate cyclohydrolase